MEYLPFIFGLIAGGVIVWVVFRGKVEDAGERGMAQSRGELTALRERLQGRDQQVAELRQALDRGGEEIAALQVELRAEGERRAAAEEKNRRVAELEVVIEKTVFSGLVTA
jgi:DNA recombination protein RmuC